MIHRLHNRNTGYDNNLTSTLAINKATLNATEGATALDINVVQQKTEDEEIKNENNEPSFENISIENATYLQSVENISSDKDFKPNDKMSTFEVDSIELATPELFSNDSEMNLSNNEKEPKVFKSSNLDKDIETKEPKLFEETNTEEDFEIPAFLRRQKN